jgi:hypothetical protein
MTLALRYRVNPDLDGYKKVFSSMAGSHIWLPVTNRKQEVLPVRTPLPGTLLLVAWQSSFFLTPSWPDYTKTPPQTGGCTFFVIEKSLQTTFFSKDLSLKHILRNRSRLTNIFTRPFWAVSVQIFGSHICPQPSRLGLMQDPKEVLSSKI